MWRWILLLVCAMGCLQSSSAQENPFDVYRNQNVPSSTERPATTTDLKEITPDKLPSSSPENQITNPVADLSVESEPNKEQLASAFVSKTDNPFDVYYRNHSTEIPETILKEKVEIPESKLIHANRVEKNTNEDKPESKVILDSSATETSEPEPIPVERIEDKDLKSPNTSNPFNILREESSDESSEILTETPKNTITKSFEEKKQHSNIQEEIITSDKKVKGYFKNILANYIFWVLLGFLVLLTFIVNINRKLIPDIARSLFNDNYLRISFREYSKGFTPFLNYLLYANFFVQGGIFLYQSQPILMGDYTFSWYGLIGGIAAIYLTKHLSLSVIGGLFPVHKETSQHSFVIMQYNLILGLIFFVLNWLLAFGPENFHNILVFSGLGIATLAYLMRQFRGFLLSLRILSLYTFHFFLYLCALEIAPLLVFFKLASENF